MAYFIYNGKFVTTAGKYVIQAPPPEWLNKFYINENMTSFASSIYIQNLLESPPPINVNWGDGNIEEIIWSDAGEGYYYIDLNHDFSGGIGEGVIKIDDFSYVENLSMGSVFNPLDGLTGVNISPDALNLKYIQMGYASDLSTFVTQSVWPILSLDISNTALNSFTYQSWPNIYNLNLSDNYLDDATVSQILIDASNGSVYDAELYLSGGNMGNPSADALIAKTNLENRGWLVEINTLYVSSAEVKDTTPNIIELNLNFELNELYVPDTTAFSISGGKSVLDVSINNDFGYRVLVYADSSYVYGDSITIDYTKPATNFIRSLSGLELTSFSDQEASNSIFPIPYLVSGVISNDTPNQILLTFSEYITTNANGNPPTTAFVVSGGKTITGAVCNGNNTITLTADSDFIFEEAVTLDYIKPMDDYLVSSDYNKDVNSFTDASITNNTLYNYPVLTFASVRTATPGIIQLDFSKELNAAVAPATSAFSITGGANITDVSISMNSVFLTLDATLAWDDAETVSYTIPGSNKLIGTNNYDASAFTNQPITNMIYSLEVINYVTYASYYNPLTISVTSDISIYSDGIATLYDSPGTNPSKSKTIVADGNLHTVYVNMSGQGSANIQFSDLAAVNRWGDPSISSGWTNGGLGIDVSVLRFPNLEKMYVSGIGPLTFNVADLPEGMTDFKVNNAQTTHPLSFYGDIAALPSTMTYFEGGCQAQNTYSNTSKLYGNLANLPSGMAYFSMAGNSYNITYDPSGRTWGNMAHMDVRTTVNEGLTPALMDQLIIDLANSTWYGSGYGNGKWFSLWSPSSSYPYYIKRTAASNAAIASLQSQGVYINIPV